MNNRVNCTLKFDHKGLPNIEALEMMLSITGVPDTPEIIMGLNNGAEVCF